MSLPIQLRWAPSAAASGFHAAAALLRGHPLDPALTSALAAPAEQLRVTLREEHIDLERFLSHLVPLGASVGGLRELADVLLVKMIGLIEVPFGYRLVRFQGLLTDLKIAFLKAVPAAGDVLLPRLEALRQAWDYRGAAVLTWLARSMEAGLLVEEATVIGVYPALGGGGGAYLPYNAACIELPPADPVAELPEVLRLAWMLALLNMDVPRYSEGRPAERMTALSGLAMVPVVLASAEAVEVARCDGPTMDRAVRAWMRPAADDEATWLEALHEWWEVYREMRPAWPTALRALEKLLAGEGPGGEAAEPAGVAEVEPCEVADDEPSEVREAEPCEVAPEAGDDATTDAEAGD